MWIRMRIDISFAALLAGIVDTLIRGNADRAQRRQSQIVTRAWAQDDHSLATLSIRSAFDLLLRTKRFPAGTEVAFTALTVPDMVKIAEAHGLKPVPVELDCQGQICLASLRLALTENTKVLVVAHLFGGKCEIQPLLPIIRERSPGLLLVEDCAQSFNRVGESGHVESDIVLHSFGPIKTATALGGCLARIADRELRDRMRSLLSRDPIQSKASYLRRLIKFFALWCCSGKLAAAAFCWVARTAGRDVDALLSQLGRGFDADRLFEQLRRRPCVPLLKMLIRRWRTYDWRRIEKRTRLGRQLDRQLTVQHGAQHSYWVYPMLHQRRKTLCERLQRSGFDATCSSRMFVVPAADATRRSSKTQAIWDELFFLPWYPDLDEHAVQAMGDIILKCEKLLVVDEATNPCEPKRLA